MEQSCRHIVKKQTWVPRTARRHPIDGLRGGVNREFTHRARKNGLMKKALGQLLLLCAQPRPRLGEKFASCQVQKTAQHCTAAAASSWTHLVRMPRRLLDGWCSLHRRNGPEVHQTILITWHSRWNEAKAARAAHRIATKISGTSEYIGVVGIFKLIFRKTTFRWAKFTCICDSYAPLNMIVITLMSKKQLFRQVWGNIEFLFYIPILISLRQACIWTDSCRRPTQNCSFD